MIMKSSFPAFFCLCIVSHVLYANDNITFESKRLPAINSKLSPSLLELNQTETKSLSTQRHVVPLHTHLTIKQPTFLQEKRVPDLLITAQQKFPLIKAPAPLITFEGANGNDIDTVFGSTSLPSDVNGDVGPSHYVQMVQGLYQIFDKQTGDALIKPLKLSSLFAAAGMKGPCATEDEGDPIVLYDALATRWLLSQFNFKRQKNGIDKPPYHECIAISTTDDPTGSYYLYDTIIPNNNQGDYPKFGVWKDGYYMTIEQFKNHQRNGSAVMVFDRQRMLQGQSAGVNYHAIVSPGLSALLPSDRDGDSPPAGTPNYVIGIDINDTGTFQTLRIFEVKADFSKAMTTGSIKESPSLNSAFYNPEVCNGSQICIPQPSGFNNLQLQLNAVSDRLMYRLQYRYFAQNCPVDNTLKACGTLVFNHTIRGNKKGEAAVRWYILKQNTETQAWSIAQQGTFAPDSTSRWMGSAALNKRGDLAIGYSMSSRSLYPSIGYAGRLVDDAPNRLSMEGLLYAGQGAQVDPGARWGDYTMLSVDPVDECTFWYTNQYYANNEDGYYGLWRTRIGSFKLSDDCF